MEFHDICCCWCVTGCCRSCVRTAQIIKPSRNSAHWTVGGFSSELDQAMVWLDQLQTNSTEVCNQVCVHGIAHNTDVFVLNVIIIFLILRKITFLLSLPATEQPKCSVIRECKWQEIRTNCSNHCITHHANDLTSHWSFLKFRKNVKILRQMANSAAWLEIPQPAENCGP